MSRYQKGSHIPLHCAAQLPILHHHVHYATHFIPPSWTPPCSRRSYSRCHYCLSNIWESEQPMHRIPNMLRREARQYVSTFWFLGNLGRGSMRLLSFRSSVHGGRWQGRSVHRRAVDLFKWFTRLCKRFSTPRNTTSWHLHCFLMERFVLCRQLNLCDN